MQACERVSITILVDNYIDMLMQNTPTIRRQGMPEHFLPRRGTPLAENGISFLIRATTAGRTTTILFDAGMSGIPIIHNAGVLGVDLAEVDQVVLSHGHPDHFGGIYAALGAIGRRVPLVVHPSAFHPRSIRRPDLMLQYFNRALTEAELVEAGAGVVAVREPLDLAPGITTSGEIPTTVDFEHEVPTGRMTIRDGHVHPDPIEDYLTLVLNVAGVGLVVLDPCGHSGVLSSLDHARTVGDGERLHGVLGGFHLGHAGITQEKIDQTVDGLIERELRLVSPMHCSGFRAQRAVAERMPEAFALMTAGAELVIEARAESERVPT
ncbi:MBL fold metallo-hydrolase [Homoserinibacter sp. YIM 151385]|uniref:MBL fold metallo-hydrolase n=1 Tax=Homoserinibacter sp. YIM 151385 TaxID=2985506 RepID=UPI0022F042C4|nr:MBL fold metallo-hydrolase [Homoserinibacter sp. YIM 151385]WBU37098.1 MBL fold metallo-hydrolase [Homoserinibacter sp. YIM 151385]